MRPVLGVVSLLVVLAVVGVISRKQLGSASGGVAESPHSETAQPHPQQIQQQIKATVEGVMLQPRPMPDDK